MRISDWSSDVCPSDLPTFRIAWPVIATVAAASLILTVVIARLALAVHRRGVVSGREEMIGAPAVVESWRGASGHVLAHGERWKAHGQQPFKKGEQVRIKALHDLILEVEPEPSSQPPLQG